MIFANVQEFLGGRRKTRPQTQRRPTARPLAGGEVVVAVVGPSPPSRVEGKKGAP